MYYVVVDVGCIECGEMSNVLGIFTDEAVANQVMSDHIVRQRNSWNGEHRFHIDQITALDVVNRVEYQ